MKNILRLKRINLVLIFMGVLVLSTGCNGKDRPYNQTLVLSVDDSKVYLDEMMYHVMLEEMYGELYANYTGNTEDYWNNKNEDGVAMKETAKEIAMENTIRYELFHLLAIENEYTLTEDEKNIALRQANNIRTSVQPDKLEATHLTDEKLLNIQEKILLATRYYEDFLIKLGIDEQSIRNNMNLDEYNQYDIEYIYGTKHQYNEIAKLLENMDPLEDFTELASDTVLNTGKLSFLEGKNTFGEEQNLESIIISMKVGEISGIIETIKGYYIIRLNDNASNTLYNDAVKEAMNAAITNTFEPAYEDLKNSCNIRIEKNVWKKIELGSETIPKT